MVDVNNLGATYEPLTVEIEDELVNILTNDSPADKDGVKHLQKIKGKAIHTQRWLLSGAAQAWDEQPSLRMGDAHVQVERPVF